MTERDAVLESERERIAERLEEYLDDDELQEFWQGVGSGESDGDDSDTGDDDADDADNAPSPHPPRSDDSALDLFADDDEGGDSTPKGNEGFKVRTASGPVAVPQFGDVSPEPSKAEPEHLESKVVDAEQFKAMAETWVKQSIPKFNEEAAHKLINDVGPVRKAASEASEAMAARRLEVQTEGSIELESDPDYLALEKQAAEARVAYEEADARADEARRRAPLADKNSDLLRAEAQQALIKYEDAQENIAAIGPLSFNKLRRAEQDAIAIFNTRARLLTELHERELDKREADERLALAISMVTQNEREKRDKEARAAVRAFKEVEAFEDHPEHEARKKERNRASYRARTGPTEDEIWKEVKRHYREAVSVRKPRGGAFVSQLQDFLPKRHVHK